DSPFVHARKKHANNELVRKEGFFAKAFPVTDDISKHKPSEFELSTDLLFISNHFSAKYLNAGIMRNGVVYTEELTPMEETPITLQEIIESNVDEKYYLSEDAIEKFRYL